MQKLYVNRVELRLTHASRCNTSRATERARFVVTMTRDSIQGGDVRPHKIPTAGCHAACQVCGDTGKIRGLGCIVCEIGALVSAHCGIRADLRVADEAEREPEPRAGMGPRAQHTNAAHVRVPPVLVVGQNGHLRAWSHEVMQGRVCCLCGCCVMQGCLWELMMFETQAAPYVCPQNRQLRALSIC